MIRCLKILSYCELKLVDEYLLEGIEIVLFIEDEHRLLVIKGIDRAEAQWTIAVGNQYGIACDARRALVAIRECLDIRQQHKCKKCFFEDAFLAVYQVAGIMHSLTNLEFIVQWMVVSTCNTHTPMTDASVNRKFLLNIKSVQIYLIIFNYRLIVSLKMHKSHPF